MNQPFPRPQQWTIPGSEDQTVRIPQIRPGSVPPLPEPTVRKAKRRWPWVVGGLVVLGVIGSAVGGNDAPTPGPVAAPVAETIPAVVTPSASAAAPSPAPVPVPTPAAAPAAVEAPPVEPQLTVSQENALEQAESYLSFTAFSRSGLIDQLEFEGFSTSDSTFAVDNVTVDWMEQAALKAQSYLDLTSFSRSGLIDQLEFEGFTAAQAEHGVDSVGL